MDLDILKGPYEVVWRAEDLAKGDELLPDGTAEVEGGIYPRQGLSGMGGKQAQQFKIAHVSNRCLMI